MMFRFGHAKHPHWQEALELVLAQLDGQLQLEQFASDPSRPQKLGVLYCTEPLAAHLPLILKTLKQKTGVQQWVGGVASGVCSSGVEYYQEPALVAMLMELPADSARVFSGKVPLPKPGTVSASGRSALAAALVHIDPNTEDIEDLLEDLVLKVPSKKIFGGLVGGSNTQVHVALEALSGGVSGVLFSENLPIEVRLTQGVQMVGGEHQITKVHNGFIEELDARPALDVLLSDMGLPFGAQADDEVHLNQAQDLLARRFSRGLFVGVSAKVEVDVLRQRGLFSGKADSHQIKVRPVVGIDPARRSLAVSEDIHAGDRLSFCSRDEASARVDLTRMCAELRDDLDAPAPRLNDLQAAGFSGILAQRKPRGAIYIACNGRGASLFGLEGVEQQIVREQLGDLPLIGFSANGEIFNGALYGYTGVLALFF